MWIKIRHKPSSEFNILFYVGEKKKPDYNGYMQKYAQFKLLDECTPRKFFNKKRMLTAMNSIARRDKYFVKMKNVWRRHARKLVYKPREYEQCEVNQFTAEELVPLCKTFGDSYLTRYSITRNIAEFMHNKGVPTPCRETRAHAFKELFGNSYSEAQQIQYNIYHDQKEWTLRNNLIDAFNDMKTCWWTNPGLIGEICVRLNKMNNRRVMMVRVLESKQ